VKSCIVLTTINIPTLLLDYAKNFVKYNKHDVGFIVIGDIPSPHDKAKKIIQEVKNMGFEAEYYDVLMQRRWLRKFPGFAKMIPYRSDNRRNIGFLLAAQKGAEIIITIDDDNYVTEEDYLKYHNIVGKSVKLPTVSSSTGWFNPCSLLETNHGRVIYPRGYPFSKRIKEEKYHFEETFGRVVLNMGLWINDPDVDAVTHLANPTKIIRMKSKNEHIMLAPGTFSPINTQNTAFHRKILPCYYYVLMKAKIGGLMIDRYGDIWSGFFAKKAIDRMDERVTIGKPLTNHRRNVHNFLEDLKQELWGMLITEKLVDWLEKIQLEEKDYFEAYLEIAEKLQVFKETFKEYAIRKYLEKIIQAMNMWVNVCCRIM